MAYTFNSINFTVYGINPGRIPGGNISVKGVFDLPERIGKTHHDWGDEDGVEAYTDSSEIFFGGRDVRFNGVIFGANSALYSNVSTLKSDINSVTGTRVFSTPYGDFDVYVKSVKVDYIPGAAKVEMSFREPEVTISGGTLPATGASDYTIDSIPFVSFGLYTTLKKGMHQIEEPKSMEYTKYGAEGLHPFKREFSILRLSAYLIGDDLSDYQDKVKALYKIFSDPGERQIKINSEMYITCFSARGFKISDVVYNNKVHSKFSIDLNITNFSTSGF